MLRDQVHQATAQRPSGNGNTRASTSIGRILVVDDELELKAALVEALVAQGYDTLGCSSALVAIEELRDHNFDLLLTDLMMPEMDGIALLRAALEIDPHLVSVVMTGQGSIQTAVDAMKLGAFDYVLKPFRLQTLLPLLTRAVNTRRLRMENLQLRETVAIYGLCQTIAFTLDPQTVISKIADAVLQQSDADEVSILLPTSDGKELFVAAVRGENRERLLGQRISLEEGIAGWVARERTPLILDGKVDDHRFVALWPRPEIRAAISVPMHVANKLVGVINLNALNRTRPFTLGQMKALTILASTAAAALESASLYTKVQRAEEDYRSIFENAIEGIFRTTPDGRFITANPAMAQMLGYGSAEELITAVRDLERDVYVQPDRRAEFQRQLQENESVSGFEIQLRRKDGRVIHISASARVVRDENGVVLYYEGIAEDITERMRADEQEVRMRAEIGDQRQRLDNLVASVPGVVFESWGLPGTGSQRTDFVSDYVEPMLGYTVEEWLAAPDFWLSIMHPEDRERAAREASEIFASRAPGTFEFRWLARDGRVVWVTSHVAVVCDDQGEPVGFRGVSIDISGRKRMEEMQDRRVAQAALRADVSMVLARTDASLRTTLECCANSLARHLDAAFARIWTLARDESVLELQASAGMYTHIDGAHARVPVGSFKIGRIAKERRPHITNDVQHDPAVSDQEWAKREGMISFAGYPLMVEDRLVGVMALFARHALAEDTLDSMAAVGEIISQSIERKRMEAALHASEEQLRQSQKLEAIGQLAGGVAHDFNNLLTAINGYSSLALKRLDHDHPITTYLEEIKKAGDRAANLTRQLLAFGRKQILQPLALNLNDIISDMNTMLRRLIGEDVVLTAKLDPALQRVKADPGQIEQVLVNLVVNSRDAMPQGGNLTIETENVELDERYAGKHVGVLPGSYVMLAVSDTGTGMSEETRGRLFEPFFTTKEKGKGTGLGLSTVYGIVKQSGGNVWVYSEVGKGTTFKIYLPRADKAQGESLDSPILAPMPQGTETVLLVEDEEQVREIAKEILTTLGYQVLSAANGELALPLAAQYEGQIHLMITDVVMPQISGRELVTRLTPLRPDMKVLYMSGYTDDAIIRHGLLDNLFEFIQKPFTADALARKVRKALDSRPS